VKRMLWIPTGHPFSDCSCWLLNSSKATACHCDAGEWCAAGKRSCVPSWH